MHVVKEKTMLLVAIKGRHHQVEGEGSAKYVQHIRTILKMSGNWNGWTFQVRTPEGYSAVPILENRKRKKITVPVQEYSLRNVK